MRSVLFPCTSTSTSRNSSWRWMKTRLGTIPSRVTARCQTVLNSSRPPLTPRISPCFTEKHNPNGSEDLLLHTVLPISPLHWSCSSFSRSCAFVFCRAQEATTHLVNTLVWVLITPRASLKFPFWIRHTTLHWSAVTSSLLICSTGGETSFNTTIYLIIRHIKAL